MLDRACVSSDVVPRMRPKVMTPITKAMKVATSAKMNASGIHFSVQAVRVVFDALSKLLSSGLGRGIRLRG